MDPTLIGSSKPTPPLTCGHPPPLPCKYDSLDQWFKQLGVAGLHHLHTDLDGQGDKIPKEGDNSTCPAPG